MLENELISGSIWESFWTPKLAPQIDPKSCKIDAQAYLGPRWLQWTMFNRFYIECLYICYDFCLISERCWDQCSFDYNAIASCTLQQNSMRDHLSYTAQTTSIRYQCIQPSSKSNQRKQKVRATSIFTSGDASSWGPLRIADLPSKATDYNYTSLHHSDHHNIRTSNSGGVGGRGGSL